jgi:thiol-disulfide isomerase/thioredoxin
VNRRLILPILAVINLTLPAHAESSSTIPRPQIMAVKFHGDWCGSCRKMGTAFTDLQNKLDGSPILFVQLDLTNNTNKHRAVLLASALELSKAYTSKPGTGFILLINAQFWKVVKRLTADVTLTLFSFTRRPKQSVTASLKIAAPPQPRGTRGLLRGKDTLHILATLHNEYEKKHRQTLQTNTAGGVMAGRLEAKVALVTEARSGIGAETARQLAHEGARVCLIGIPAEGIEAVTSELVHAGHDATRPGCLLTSQMRALSKPPSTRPLNTLGK